MDKNVTTIFLSKALTIAFTRLAGSVSPILPVWFVFSYFVLRKINYFISDVRFADLSKDLFKSGTMTERMFSMILGVATLFLFIVAGYYVIEPYMFFLWTACALLINILWIAVLRILVDPVKDRNPNLTIRTLFKNYIIINAFEILICLVSGLWLSGKWQWPGMTFETIQPWVFGVSLGLLGFIMLLDLLLHKVFLFDYEYKCEP